MYCVYIYTNKKNGKKYCGMTCRTLKERANNGNGYCGRFGRAIQEFGWHNFEPEIIYSNLTKEQAQQLEIKTIEELKLIHEEFGYNMHFGGDKVNPEFCARKGQDNGMYGKGYKLELDKNGRAEYTEIIFPDGTCIVFNTQKEAKQFLNITSDLFRSIARTDGQYFFSKNTNKSKIEANKHVQGIIINSRIRKLKTKSSTTIESEDL